MITKTILSFIINSVSGILTLFNIPGLPVDALQSAKDYFSTLLSNLSLLGLVVRPTTLKLSTGVLCTLLIFKFAYPKLRFIIKKLPFIH